MTRIVHYFAYGSNMNPARVEARGLEIEQAEAAALDGLGLRFDKRAADGRSGHANIVYAPGERVEGVLYQLAGSHEILKMDPFERAPWNYGREVVRVATTGGTVLAAWTYIANEAVRAADLHPERAYLRHLLAGRPFLSDAYFERLRAHPTSDP